MDPLHGEAAMNNIYRIRAVAGKTPVCRLRLLIRLPWLGQCGRACCWLRARCRCAALLVLVLISTLAMPNYGA
jgi:hypothetical protein